MKRRFLYLFLAIITFFAISGCASWESQQGVRNIWRDKNLPEIQIGITSQSEVARILGPPSQVISLKKQVIFYYLLEKRKSKATFLIIYNWSQSNTTYDRAIFFFDNKGILTDFSYSLEKADYTEEKKK